MRWVKLRFIILEYKFAQEVTIMAFDCKKEYKEYCPPPKKPAIIEIPKHCCSGQGDPNTENDE
jgi:hypothetical protein